MIHLVETKIRIGIMNEKIETDFSWDDEAGSRLALSRMQEEDTLRIRMFALDMAVTALPSLVSSDIEEVKLSTVRHAATEFEKYLRGETQS